MSEQYKAPLRDIRFVRDELLDYPSHYDSLPDCEQADADIVDAILDEAARFCEKVLAPLNQIGDRQGCQWKDNEVTTPEGFVKAYEQFVASGWPALSHSEDLGGQGLPESLNFTVSEMISQANWSWAMYPGLSQGAMHTLTLHGTKEQKEIYLNKLVSGKWTGTMCLTESHCGSDLGLIQTKAIPKKNGYYKITGTKIFISAGEHDLSENIIHIVLARLPDAPKGTKGISLFVVPKFIPNDQGEIGERNQVKCGSIEDKMGIHGNATCVMNFDEAKGYLVGTANEGLKAMFTFMNAARIGTALQGLAHSERAWQGAYAYACDRLQMRSLTGVKNPHGPADPILVHPDIRRMLLTIKSLTEGGRALFYYAALLNDQVLKEKDEKKLKQADQLLGFITPIAKAFLTEVGCECANLGLQIFGGHGYIREWGMEQNVRDARIATIYEGTTGIQALDLLGRKVLLAQGAPLKAFCQIVSQFCQENSDKALQEFTDPLNILSKDWLDLTIKVGGLAAQDREEVGAAAYDYLMLSGYICLAYFWAKSAQVALEQLDKDSKESAFYKGKLQTARFYYARLLPRISMHKEAILSGAANLMSISQEQLGAGIK